MRSLRRALCGASAELRAEPPYVELSAALSAEPPYAELRVELHAELRAELRAELLQSFGRAPYSAELL